MAARQMALIDTPASSSVKEDMRRPSEATPITRNRTRAAPANAASQMAGRWPASRQPKQMAATAPSDAPLETPSV